MKEIHQQSGQTSLEPAYCIALNTQHFQSEPPPLTIPRNSRMMKLGIQYIEAKHYSTQAWYIVMAQNLHIILTTSAVLNYLTPGQVAVIPTVYRLIPMAMPLPSLWQSAMSLILSWGLCYCTCRIILYITLSQGSKVYRSQMGFSLWLRKDHQHSIHWFYSSVLIHSLYIRHAFLNVSLLLISKLRTGSFP